MNKKEASIWATLDLVIGECTMAEGVVITREDVVGKCKRENVSMTRCIFATMLVFMGYSTTTIAAILGRSDQAISDLLTAAHQYRVKSWAYRIAEAECTLRVRKIMAEE